MRHRREMLFSSFTTGLYAGFLDRLFLPWQRVLHGVQAADDNGARNFAHYYKQNTNGRMPDMKPFELLPKMLTMSGVFYPTGYMVLMFPTEKEARNAELALEDDGYPGESISLLTPRDIQEKVARTVGHADIPLPSAGSEADTVRNFASLASQGHHALMIHAPSAKQTEHVMEVLKDAHISYGQKYRHLIIEDLVDEA